MASTSAGINQGATTSKEYVVRVPKSTRKKYNMMRFNQDLGQDFFKNWSNCKMERENNFKEYTTEEIPKFGAGSEFGRELREEARRKRIGINIKKYKSEDQPWMLSISAKSDKKKYKGIREGGVSDHTAWYVFMQGKDGYFEAYPIEEWYNFQPINRYKYLSAEEAEAEFEKRGQIMNYFQVMYEKRYKKGEDEDDEDGKKTKSKRLKLSEMDDWVDDDDEDEEALSDEENSKPKGKGKRKNKRRSKRGGKKKNDDDDDCEEESDDYDEGAEHDYMSGDSSDSDQENDDKVIKELAGVEEGDALKKLLESEDEDEDEKSSESDEDDENKDKEKDKDKKKKKKSGKNDGDNSDASSDISSEEGKKKDAESNVNKLKRKMLETSQDKPDSKRVKLSQPGPSTPAGDNHVTEEAIRRYLMRKPMTTTDLLQKFKTKKTGLSSEQLVQAIALLLKKINPSKQTVKGKMYLSIKTQKM